MDDSSDTYDTIDFLLKHVPNNNGKVGIWGISYPGFYTSASIIDSHPAIAAASPQAPMTDLFLGDDSYHGGAFMLSASFGFYAPFFHAQQNPMLPQPDVASFNFGTTDSYKFYLDAGNVANLDKFMKSPTALWDDQYKHDTYDEYWQIARPLAAHEEREVRGAGGGRLVRRRRPRGPVPHLLRDPQIQSRNAHHAGRGPMGARRLGAQRRRPPGRRRSSTRRPRSTSAPTFSFPSSSTI